MEISNKSNSYTKKDLKKEFEKGRLKPVQTPCTNEDLYPRKICAVVLKDVLGRMRLGMFNPETYTFYDEEGNSLVTSFYSFISLP